MCWKLVSDPAGVTTPMAMPPTWTGELTGESNKAFARKWWKDSRSFSSIFPTPRLYNQAKDDPTPTLTSAELSSLLRTHNTYKNLKRANNNKQRVWSPQPGLQTCKGWQLLQLGSPGSLLPVPGFECIPLVTAPPSASPFPHSPSCSHLLLIISPSFQFPPELLTHLAPTAGARLSAGQVLPTAPQTFQRRDVRLLGVTLFPNPSRPVRKAGISTGPLPLDPKGQDHQERAAGWAQPGSASVQVDLTTLLVLFRSTLSSVCGFLGLEVPAINLPHKTSTQRVRPPSVKERCPGQGDFTSSA